VLEKEEEQKEKEMEGGKHRPPFSESNHVNVNF